MVSAGQECAGGRSFVACLPVPMESTPSLRTEMLNVFNGLVEACALVCFESTQYFITTHVAHRGTYRTCSCRCTQSLPTPPAVVQVRRFQAG